MKEFLQTDNRHLKIMQRKHAHIWHGMIIALCAMLAAQLIAAQWNHARTVPIRRASFAERLIGGRPGLQPPLLLIALSDEQLRLSETQKNRLRHALPLPPKSLGQERTPSLIASFQSLQAAEWKLICEVLTPQQLEAFLHRLASLRIFRLLQIKLQSLLFSSNTPTTPDVRRVGDVSAAIPMMSMFIMLAISVCLPQNAQGISGKARLQNLHILRL
ncbi:hypothetical protein U14_01640 [Candidatus Moduliflexus flocculans]|uniref:Uncharacterized protein n=1 Tax=Candidatus Moduliflexus flocculans TaxID=1499966 RepID=A0A0S6VX69_9BACT|nr:hypothetical protein U14_01640 [Candidatus Moduliflexus flocculans]